MPDGTSNTPENAIPPSSQPTESRSSRWDFLKALKRAPKQTAKAAEPPKETDTISPEAQAAIKAAQLKHEQTMAAGRALSEKLAVRTAQLDRPEQQISNTEQRAANAAQQKKDPNATQPRADSAIEQQFAGLKADAAAGKPLTQTAESTREKQIEDELAAIKAKLGK